MREPVRGPEAVKRSDSLGAIRRHGRCASCSRGSTFLTTARWAAQPGALHGWRKPWYALALIVTTALVVAARRQIGQPVRVGRPAAHRVLLAGGAGVLVTSLLCRLPPSTWTQIPFKDDWTPLFQQAVNGAALLRRGVVVGWNWWFLGGYPTSTDIAQNFGTLALVPMTLFGDRLGYHVLHAVLFLAVPLFVWWDLRDEDREIRVVGDRVRVLLRGGLLRHDRIERRHELAGRRVLRRPRADRRPFSPPGPPLGRAADAARPHARALHPHGVLRLRRDLPDARGGLLPRSRRLRPADRGRSAARASRRSRCTGSRCGSPTTSASTTRSTRRALRSTGPVFARTFYYNVEILLLPHRWFNDYRSLANVWLPALLLVAVDVSGDPASASTRGPPS